MAHISRDESLLRAFAEGRDIHRATASEVFSIPVEDVSSQQRSYVKAINFGLITDVGFRLSSSSISSARRPAVHGPLFRALYGCRRVHAAHAESARRDGYVETVFGRRLWLQEIRSGSPARRQAAERAAINAPMQGTAADLIKLAMIRVQDWLESERVRTKLIMQVHDELVLEVPDAEVERVRAELPGLMSNVAELAVPLVVEIGAGPNWEQAH